MPQMVENNEDPKMTAFTVSVDAKLGTSTGISAGDRARTLRALANPEVTNVTALTSSASAAANTLRMYVRSMESKLLLEKFTSDLKECLVRMFREGHPRL